MKDKSRKNMLNDKEAKRIFYIYKCVSTLKDGTTIERIIKIQSFFNVEDLSIALVTLSDIGFSLPSVKVVSEDYENEFDNYSNRLYADGFSFADLEDNKNLKITFKYEDKSEVVFDCEYIGMDKVSKPITKKLPLIISANGYSFNGYEGYKKEYSYDIQNYKKLDYSNFYDPFYGLFVKKEKEEMQSAIKRFHVLFSSFKEDYYFDI